MSYGDDPGLAVLPAIIHSVERGAGKHLGGVGEVETTFVKRPITFRRIEGDLHPIIIVPPKMPPVERRVSEAPSSIRVTGRWIVLGWRTMEANPPTPVGGRPPASPVSAPRKFRRSGRARCSSAICPWRCAGSRRRTSRAWVA